MTSLKYKLYNAQAELKAAFEDENDAAMFQDIFNDGVEETFYDEHEDEEYTWDACPIRLYFFEDLDDVTQKEIIKKYGK